MFRLFARYWIVRARRGGIEVPIFRREVAAVYREAGWEVLRRWGKPEV